MRARRLPPVALRSGDTTTAEQRNIFGDGIHSLIVTDSGKLTEKIERTCRGGEREVESAPKRFDIELEWKTEWRTTKVWT